MRSSVPSSRTRRHGTRARAVLGLAAALLLLSPAAAQAVPATGDAGKDRVVLGVSSQPQPLSKADLNPGGANNGGDCGAYCSTRDGSLAQNGQGRNGHVAGSKGAADNKFPPGQAPDGSDGNNGYECDGNRGVGVSNPAHTGCTTSVARCVAGQTVTVRWGKVELGQPGRWGLVERKATAVSLLPGTYKVRLTSTDPMHRAGFQTNQTQEQWYVVLKRHGAVAATTRTIADLPDASTTRTQPVGKITLASGATAAVATHRLAGTGRWTSPESVQPTAAVFTCV